MVGFWLDKWGVCIVSPAQIGDAAGELRAIKQNPCPRGVRSLEPRAPLIVGSPGSRETSPPVITLQGWYGAQLSQSPNCNIGDVTSVNLESWLPTRWQNVPRTCATPV